MRANTLAVRRARERARAKGYCGTCCARPARPGRRTCERCGDRAVKRRDDTKERRELEGLCVSCGALPPLATTYLCLRCAEAGRQGARDRRLRRRWGPVIWLLAVADLRWRRRLTNSG